MEIKWYLILFATILWFIISITALTYAINWQYNQRFVGLSTPTEASVCNRNFVIQSWIYDVYGSNQCPQPQNSVITVDNVLYSKNLVSSSSVSQNCCSFGDVLTRVDFPEVYIGQRGHRFTDNELNTRSFVVNANKTSYSFVCGICIPHQTYQLNHIEGNRYYFTYDNQYNVYFTNSGFILTIVRNGDVLAERINNQLVLYDNSDTIAVIMTAIEAEGGFQPLAVETY
jgi:hypothetical protein